MKIAILAAALVFSTLSSHNAFARPNAGAPPVAVPPVLAPASSPYIGQIAIIRDGSNVRSSVGGCDAIQITGPMVARGELHGVITGILKCGAYDFDNYFIIDYKGNSILVNTGAVSIGLGL